MHNEIGVIFIFNSEEILKQLHSKFKKTSFPVGMIVQDVLQTVFPATSKDGHYTLRYLDFRFDISNFHVPNPAILFATAPIYVLFRLENHQTGEYTEEEVLFGELPYFF